MASIIQQIYDQYQDDECQDGLDFLCFWPGKVRKYLETNPQHTQRFCQELTQLQADVPGSYFTTWDALLDTWKDYWDIIKQNLDEEYIVGILNPKKDFFFSCFDLDGYGVELDFELIDICFQDGNLSTYVQNKLSDEELVQFCRALVQNMEKYWPLIKQTLDEEYIMGVLEPKMDEFIDKYNLGMYGVEMDFELIDVCLTGDVFEYMRNRLSNDRLEQIYQGMLESEFPEYENWHDLVNILDHDTIETYINQRKDEFIEHYDLAKYNITVLCYDVIDVCVLYSGFDDAPPRELAKVFPHTYILTDNFSHFDELTVCCTALHMGYTPERAVDLLAHHVGWNCTKPSDYGKMYVQILNYQQEYELRKSLVQK